MNKNLVNAIKDKNMVEFTKEVGAMLSSKVQETLATKKMEIATSMGINESKINEVAPKDMEQWVLDNKQRFIDQYGEEEGLKILYATAWKMSNEKSK